MLLVLITVVYWLLNSSLCDCNSCSSTSVIYRGPSCIYSLPEGSKYCSETSKFWGPYFLTKLVEGHGPHSCCWRGSKPCSEISSRSPVGCSKSAKSAVLILNKHWLHAWMHRACFIGLCTHLDDVALFNWLVQTQDCWLSTNSIVAAPDPFLHERAGSGNETMGGCG